MWCISNHNSGQTWFDNLKLTVSQLPAVGKGSYDQFLKEHPTHPLAIDAHLMRVRSVMTQAKWIRENGFYDPEAQKRASQLYAQAAEITRDNAVLKQATTTGGKAFTDETNRFEALIDEALWLAVFTARNGGDITNTRQYLSKIVQRNRDPDFKATAEAWIKDIDAELELND